MSLKAVHLIFVTALSALAFGTAVWKARDYAGPAGNSTDLIFAAGAFATGVLVIIYGIFFLRKLRKVSYL